MNQKKKIIIIHSVFYQTLFLWIFLRYFFLVTYLTSLARLATATCTCEPNYFLMSSPLKKVDVDAMSSRVPYVDFAV